MTQQCKKKKLNIAIVVCCLLKKLFISFSYPYGGQANISSNEGLAYSCMMVMAHGFNRTIYNSSIHSTNSTDTLAKLAAGQLGQYLTPSTFNTSFVGPEGPVIFDQNGDMASG